MMAKKTILRFSWMSENQPLLVRSGAPLAAPPQAILEKTILSEASRP
jgi:hypothetical protein